MPIKTVYPKITIRGHVATWTIQGQSDGTFIVTPGNKKYKDEKTARWAIRTAEEKYVEANPNCKVANRDIWFDHGVMITDDDFDNYFESNDSLIPIEKHWDDENEVNIRNPHIDSNPYEVYNGYDIYKGIDEFDEDVYYIFPHNSINIDTDTADAIFDDLDSVYDWIENHNLEESKRVHNDFNKEDIKECSKGESDDLEEGLIVVERKTFGDYEKNVFTALDNIEFLVSSYEEVNNDTLKTLIGNLEDELEVLKDISMKLFTGIKQYTL